LASAAAAAAAEAAVVVFLLLLLHILHDCRNLMKVADDIAAVVDCFEVAHTSRGLPGVFGTELESPVLVVVPGTVGQGQEEFPEVFRIVLVGFLGVVAHTVAVAVL